MEQAERNVSKEAKRKERAPSLSDVKRRGDEVELADAVDASRDPKGNDQEEAHEDRQESGHYDAHGRVRPGGGPELDVAG